MAPSRRTLTSGTARLYWLISTDLLQAHRAGVAPAFPSGAFWLCATRMVPDCPASLARAIDGTLRAAAPVPTDPQPEARHG